MRAAQAEAEKFLEHIGLADERIVVGNEIIRREAVERLARNRMADVAAAAIHVHAKHAGVQTFVDDLVVVADGIVADRSDKEIRSSDEKTCRRRDARRSGRSDQSKRFREPGIATPFASSV